MDSFIACLVFCGAGYLGARGFRNGLILTLIGGMILVYTFIMLMDTGAWWIYKVSFGIGLFTGVFKGHRYYYQLKGKIRERINKHVDLDIHQAHWPLLLL